MAGNERYVQVGQAKLYCDVTGTGTPILFVHAGVADSRMWNAQVEALSGGYQVIRYDMRGFGRTPMPDGPFAGWTDLRAVLDDLGIEKAHLVAASMGGAVAIDFALHAPDRVLSLVLAAPSIGGYPDWSEAVQQFGEAEETALEAGDIDAAVEANLRMWVDGPHRTPDQVDPAVRGLVADMQKHAFELPMGEGVPQRPEVPAFQRLSDISAPTLVVVGALDVADFHTMADRLAEQVKGARKVVVDGAAHVLSLEQPELFSRLIREHVSR